MATTDISRRHVSACILSVHVIVLNLKKMIASIEIDRIETRDRYVGSRPIIYYLPLDAQMKHEDKYAYKL